MRQSLKQLMQSAIVLQYNLPANVAGVQIPRAHISTANDDCLKQIGTNEAGWTKSRMICPSMS